MAGECAPPQVISDFVSRDSGRLYGEVAKAIVIRSPYLNWFPSGTLDNNMGNSFRTSVQERTVLAGSLVNPTFVADVAACGLIPAADRSGSKEFTMALGTFRGRSNKICIKQAKTAFKTAYLRQQEAMKDGVTRIVNAESRAQGLLFGGTKFVAGTLKGSTVSTDGAYTQTGGTNANFSDQFSGSQLSIATPFNGNVIPNAAMTFKGIKQIANYMKNTLGQTPFQTQGNGAMVQCTFGDEQTDRFRDEIDTRADLRAALMGRYKLGEQLLNSFEYEGPYREIGFGIDPQPLRAVPVAGGANAVLTPNAAPFTTAFVPGLGPADVSAGNATTAFAFVEPEIAVNTTNGVGSRPNPAWVAAPVEFGFVVFDGSFTRLTPKTYVGEGDMRFPGTLGLETLSWDVIKDNDCNRFGDFGDFVYEISRAYEPMHPEAICTVAYKRCPMTSGLVAC